MAKKKSYFPPKVGNILGEVGQNSTRPKSGTIVLGTVVDKNQNFTPPADSSCSVIFQGGKFRGDKSKNILAGSGACAPVNTVM